jgi:hypothetical protein
VAAIAANFYAESKLVGHPGGVRRWIVAVDIALIVVSIVGIVAVLLLDLRLLTLVVFVLMAIGPLIRLVTAHRRRAPTHSA